MRCSTRARFIGRWSAARIPRRSTRSSTRGIERTNALRQRLEALDEAQWGGPVTFMFDGKPAGNSTVEQYFWGFLHDMIHHRGRPHRLHPSDGRQGAEHLRPVRGRHGIVEFARAMTDIGKADGSLRLAAKHLVKIYKGRRVVRDVSVEIRQGEIVGLLGPNGAGKTTTFYMIVGLVRPDDGSVILGDDDITELPMYLRAQRGISYLPQEASVFRKLTVEENLLAVFETMDLPLAERQRRTRAAARGIRHHAHRAQPGVLVVGGGAAARGDRAGASRSTRHSSC